ncbi:unnamed protein product [Paramecium sonneborni]|uniref:Uncharacterized protein n=1 Tax=Paramecium sonneborni TaxID=65129 RepID=A0A8S1QF70_9CILI|nr:unnamed protein product [Paramecium sonneborni]
MQTVWTLIHPTRICVQKTIKNLLPSGQEIQVLQQEIVDKRHSNDEVKANYKYWHKKYKSYIPNSFEFITHDYDNFCKVGDKVVIKHCEKTGGQYYYLRNVVIIPVGRIQQRYLRGNERTLVIIDAYNKIRNIRIQLVQSGL